MSLFGANPKKEDEEAAKLFNKDSLISMDTEEKIRALAEKVSTVKAELDILCQSPEMFVKNLSDSFLASENVLVARLGSCAEMLEAADAELDQDRDLLGSLMKGTARITSIIRRIKSEDSKMLKMPIVRGRDLLNRLKAIEENEKRQLTIECKGIEIAQHFLARVHLLISGPAGAVNRINLAKGAISTVEKFNKIQFFESMATHTGYAATDINSAKASLGVAEKILEGIINFLESFRIYLQHAGTQSSEAARFEEQVLKYTG